MAQKQMTSGAPTTPNPYATLDPYGAAAGLDSPGADGQQGGLFGGNLMQLIKVFGPAIVGYMFGGPVGGFMGYQFGQDTFGDRQTATGDWLAEQEARQNAPARQHDPAFWESLYVDDPAAGQRMYQGMPYWARDAFDVQGGQIAARNVISQQNYENWQNMMSGAYGAAGESLRRSAELPY